MFRFLIWNERNFRIKDRLEKEEIRGRQINLEVNIMFQVRNDSQNQSSRKREKGLVERYFRVELIGFSE